MILTSLVSLNMYLHMLHTLSVYFNLLFDMSITYPALILLLKCMYYLEVKQIVIV